MPSLRQRFGIILALLNKGRGFRSSYNKNVPSLQLSCTVFEMQIADRYTANPSSAATSRRDRDNNAVPNQLLNSYGALVTLSVKCH